LYWNSCDIFALARIITVFNGARRFYQPTGSTTVEIASARVSTIVHATEDADRVHQALIGVFPDGFLPTKPETRRFHGHYGNEIRMIDLSIRGGPANSLFEHVWKSLASFDRASILRELDAHVDTSGALHLRFDKEEAFRGIVKLKDQDPIKIQLSFRTRIKSDLGLNEGIRQLLESLEKSWQTSLA
jgi:RNA-binding protein